MRKKLAIIGASYLQLPLVLKAKEMNVETHCFAWEDGAICKEHCDYFYPISVTEKELILEKCKEIGIDGITTIATDLPIPTIAFVAEKLNLVANSYETALKATDKALMRKCFYEKSVDSPKFIKTHSSDFSLPSNFAYPIIAKPTDRSGSRGVTKVTNPSELNSAIENALDSSIGKQVIIEEYIDGDEVSVESISWQGRHYILSITDKKTTGEPNFVELEHHQPSSLNNSIKLKIESLTIKALNSLGIINGASHTEIKINHNADLFVIEIGARMGGDFIGSHLVELSTGYDFIKGVVNVSLNQFLLPKIDSNKFSGVYFLSKESEKIKSYFNSKNDFDIQKEILNNELKFLKDSNDRSGYLIYQSTKKVILK